MNALANQIAIAIEKLNKAIAAQAKAEKEYSLVKSLNGQDGYSVSVNGVRVDVAVMNQHTYMAAMVRGREMIHLGALKALSAMARDAALAVAAHRREVAALSARMAETAGKEGGE